MFSLHTRELWRSEEYGATNSIPVSCVVFVGRRVDNVQTHTSNTQTEKKQIKNVYVFQDGIVEQLQRRFEQNQIYTYIGDILVAVNPFIDLGLYTDVVSGFII